VTKKDDEKVYPAASGQTSSEMNLEAQKKGLARPSGVDNTKDVEKALLADSVKQKHASEIKIEDDDKATADSTEDDKALPEGNSNDAPGENPGHGKGEAKEVGPAPKEDRVDSREDKDTKRDSK
jgi:hypothetical protein